MVYQDYGGISDWLLVLLKITRPECSQVKQGQCSVLFSIFLILTLVFFLLVHLKHIKVSALLFYISALFLEMLL